MKTIEDLMTAFGNANYDCGEFDDEEMTLDESADAYHLLVEVVEKAREALRKEIYNLRGEV